MFKSEALEGTAGFEVEVDDLTSEDDTNGARRLMEVVPDDIAGFVVPDGASDARLAVPAAIDLLASTVPGELVLRSSTEAIDGLER